VEALWSTLDRALERRSLEMENRNIKLNREKLVNERTAQLTLRNAELVGTQRKSYQTMFHNLSKVFDGSYNIVLMDGEGTLVAVRDPNGFRPLCYAEDEEKILVASEGCAITNFVSNGYKSIKPGEMLIVRNGKLKIHRFAVPKRISHCMFEWVYFSNPVSVLDESSVYKTRYMLGKELAKKEFLTRDDETIVVAVPDTAKPIASAFSYYTQIPEMEGLLRNRFVGRTFIESANREERVKEKFLLIGPVLKGKKVILIEDSIVRGTTSKALIEYIRNKGKAKEVHLRVGCPPIRFPCFYGIDMSTQKELISCQVSSDSERAKVSFHDLSPEIIERIRKKIGADSLIYQPLDGLIRSIDQPGGSKNLCMGCLTGKYPTPTGNRLRNKAIESFSCGDPNRTYEEIVQVRG
ncbi:MAG: amidophosphoribosyltransferase, partial [Candidatus Diapherotrites archaeon]|nr:amidophosphoribosyltransferase [Candidatus Diapherotrites archaeon]